MQLKLIYKDYISAVFVLFYVRELSKLIPLATSSLLVTHVVWRSDEKFGRTF